jgi:hypothetical protein
MAKKQLCVWSKRNTDFCLGYWNYDIFSDSRKRAGWLAEAPSFLDARSENLQYE